MKHTIKIIAGLLALLLVLTGCSQPEAPADDPVEPAPGSDCENTWYNVKSDSLYVQKVENLPEDFIMGMDASCVPALEASGVRYYDYDGTQRDVYEILSANGINYIRVRVWNDPFEATATAAATAISKTPSPSASGPPLPV